MIIFHNIRDNKIVYTTNSLEEDFINFLKKDLQSNEFKIYYTPKSVNDIDMKGRLQLNDTQLEIYRQDFTASDRDWETFF